MVGTIAFRPIEANLTINDQDLIGKMDPYVQFTIGDQTAKSSVCSGGGNNPEWKDTVKIFSSGSPVCLVQIKDRDPIHDDKLGFFEIDIAELESVGRIKKWYPVFNAKHQPTGEILLEAAFTVGALPEATPVKQVITAQNESPVRHHAIDSPVTQQFESPVRTGPGPVTTQTVYQTGPQSTSVTIPRPGGGTATVNQTYNQTVTTTTTTYNYSKPSGIPVGTESVYTGSNPAQPVGIQQQPQPVTLQQQPTYNSQNVGYVSYIVDDFGDDYYAHESLMRGVDPYNTHNAILTNSQLSYGQRSDAGAPEGQMAFGHGHNDANKML